MWMQVIQQLQSPAQNVLLITDTTGGGCQGRVINVTSHFQSAVTNAETGSAGSDMEFCAHCCQPMVIRCRRQVDCISVVLRFQLATRRR